MKVSLCIPTRGRPERIQNAIRSALETRALAETVVVAACDADDETNAWAVNFDGNGGVRISVEEREDSLGKKYTRCAKACDADLYVIWADDHTMPTQGWDQRLVDVAGKFGSDAGIIYFGNVPNVFQPGIAVNAEMYRAMEFLCVPYFPFWWHDTWIDEIGRMSDRIVAADVQVGMDSTQEGKSRGVRDVAWWAEFFDRTRPMRKAVALKLIENESPWRREQLLQRLPFVEQFLVQRNAKLRDPVAAQAVEKYYGFDVPDEADERYVRIQLAAVQLLKDSNL